MVNGQCLRQQGHVSTEELATGPGWCQQRKWRGRLWLVHMGQSGADTWQLRFCPMWPYFQNFWNQGGSNPWPPRMDTFSPELAHQMSYGKSWSRKRTSCIYCVSGFCRKKARWSGSTPRSSDLWNYRYHIVWNTFQYPTFTISHNNMWYINTIWLMFKPTDISYVTTKRTIYVVTT